MSRVAEAQDMPQPSVSVVLAKLRAHFGDQLFVRTGQTMQPTNRATQIFKAIDPALSVIAQVSREMPVFIPATAVRRFRVAIADGGKLILLPKLLHKLEAEAPNVTIEVIATGFDTSDSLESGDVDLSIGLMQPRKPSLFSQVLFEDGLGCIVSLQMGSRRLTRTQVCAAGHVMVEVKGTSTGIVAKALENAKITPRIAAVVPTYFGVAEAVAQTNLIAIVPLRMAEVLSVDHPIKVLALPFKSPMYKVNQHWHRRMHEDAGHKWLRQQIFELF